MNSHASKAQARSLDFSTAPRARSFHTSPQEPRNLRSQASPKYRAKVVLLGEASSGKTSLLCKFLTGAFTPALPSTIGASYWTHCVRREGLEICLDIWDTAGQERYHGIAPMYFRDAHCAVVVYDVTDRDSLGAAVKWCRTLRMKNPAALLLVFANKKDLLETQDVRNEDSERFKVFSAEYIQGSAKTGEGVPELFRKISRDTPYSKPSQKNIPSSLWFCGLL